MERNPDERHFWEQKVRSLAAAHPDDFVAGAAIDRELRAYLAERAGVVSCFSDVPAGVSMRNLAEYLLRVWIGPRTTSQRKGAKTQRKSQ